MKHRVTINGKFLGETEIWEAPTALVERALADGLITPEEADLEHVIETIDTGVPYTNPGAPEPAPHDTAVTFQHWDVPPDLPL